MTKWKLDPKDVRRTMGDVRATTVTQSHQFNRQNQLRTYELKLVHQPTQVTVARLFGPAQHSKKKWNQILEDGYDDLWPELEEAVARHLRIPGW